MRLTPLDIQNQHFQRRLGGYDRGEVEGFLRVVAEDSESLLRENQALSTRVKHLEARVEELQSTEKLLRDAIVTAQAMSDDLRQTALKESEVVLGEAEIRAEKILDAAHRRAAELAEDIREMKLLRTRLASAVRTTVETHLALLEGLAEDPLGEEPVLESRVAGLSRRRIAEECSPERPPEDARATYAAEGDDDLLTAIVEPEPDEEGNRKTGPA